MYRGCEKKGFCDEYERKDENSIQLKVLECSECNEHYCNAAIQPITLTSIRVFTLIIVTNFFIQ